MDEGVLEIRAHEGEGFKPLVAYDSWRVAILCFEDGLFPGRQSSLERHLETDEVFVLTKGQGTLILAGNACRVGRLTLQEMEIGKIYNVRKNAWHSICLSPDGSVLIVENRETGPQNSEYADLSEEQRKWIAEAVQETHAHSEHVP